MLATKYATEGADELIYVDTVASLYGRNALDGLITRTVDKVFIPVTVAGGVRSLNDVKRLLGAGADKVAINTAAIRNPALIDQCAASVGCQGIVVSIEAKTTAPGRWECYTDNGRERSGKDAVAWANEAVQRGAGEILLTSIDRDGTCRGFDIQLCAAIAPYVTVPVIASGGMGGLLHLQRVLNEGHADAIATASWLHGGGDLNRLRAALRLPNAPVVSESTQSIR
jgi:cyclase